MKTMLVPVDFTPATHNAVLFAAEWAKKYGYRQIILFKTFYDSMFEYLAVAGDYTITNSENLNAQREQATGPLEDLRKELLQLVNESITVSISVSELPLLRGIFEELQGDNVPELIMLGSAVNGPGKSSVSDNIIAIAKASPVKVLIVPSDYTYRPVQNVLVPCDVNGLDALQKLDRVKNNSNLVGANLLILNVDIKGHASNRNMDMEHHIDAYLENFAHEIFYRPGKDVINGILSFINDKDIQLIIALPGKHSFLYYVANKSISQAIYRNAKQPVLILK
jgi:hypothetical protein